MQDFTRGSTASAAWTEAHDRNSVFPDKRACANLLGVPVDAVNMDGAIQAISHRLNREAKGYVCAIGVHGILEALRNHDVANAFATSVMNVPDGTPTVWVGRTQGFHDMDHVTGPALMREIFGRCEFLQYSHFFYGGKPGIADELASAMLRISPNARIAGTFTPPFRDLTAKEEQMVAFKINACRADIIWVGISTPRQELWMRRMLPLLNVRLLFGVGAAFDFNTGHIRECPAWIKRSGFNWLHRLAQDPKRLWRRNVQNAGFLWHILLQLTGVRTYPLRNRAELATSHGSESRVEGLTSAELV
jgi:N-acetylglucosaminyldiphosphoundecaprenol N-acetyl-beta-D-mannosaminyltransferase